MLKIIVHTNLPAKIDKAIANFNQKQAALLQEIGTTILSRQQLSFEKKSRGGQGDDGVKWAPLAESTERRKSRKEKDRNAKRNRVKKLKDKLRKATTKAERSRLMDMIQVESSPNKSQIGVDTGMMRNTVTPGYKASDGKGDNVFEVEGATVTVGYGREYAPYFDAGSDRVPARPLMPDRMPDQWMDAIDRVVGSWVQDIVSELER